VETWEGNNPTETCEIENAEPAGTQHGQNFELLRVYHNQLTAGGLRF